MLYAVLIIAASLLVALLSIPLLHLMSVLSGWQKLANQFRSSPVGREKLLFQTIKLNGINYASCIELSGSAAGLYMRPMLVFGISHPGVLIPWGRQEIRKNEKGHPYYLQHFVELEIIGNPPATLRMSEKSYLQLKKLDKS